MAVRNVDHLRQIKGPDFVFVTSDPAQRSSERSEGQIYERFVWCRPRSGRSTWVGFLSQAFEHVQGVSGLGNATQLVGQLLSFEEIIG